MLYLLEPKHVTQKFRTPQRRNRLT